MPQTAAIIFWCFIAAYAALGALVALYVLIFGMRRVDANAAAAPLRVKMLLMPGLIALWPIILSRLSGSRPSEDAQ